LDKFLHHRCEPVGSNSLEPTIKLKPTQESQESSQEDLDPLKSCFKNLDLVRFLVQSRTSRENCKVFYEEQNLHSNSTCLTNAATSLFKTSPSNPKPTKAYIN
jgi:alpha-D-ribose 1-methylphosphonate 5-triphosphate diphosphatase PhnM